MRTDPYYRKVLATAPLAETSKLGYASRIRVLKDICPGWSIHRLLTHPSDVLEGVRSRFHEAHSVKSMITAMLTLFKYTPGLRDTQEPAYREWRAAFDEVHERAQARYETNTPSARQQASYVPWSEVLAARDALPPDSLEYLWMCCHTMIPPVRADLDHVAVHADERTQPDAPNYLLLAPGRVELVLREFKTSGGRAPYRKVLPAELAGILVDSLRRRPRDFLIVSPSTHEPFQSAQAYTNWANRMLRRLFKPRNVSISVLRHSFITSLDHNALTSGQKDAIAADMMHSAAMFDRYRIIFPRPAVPTPT